MHSEYSIGATPEQAPGELHSSPMNVSAVSASCPIVFSSFQFVLIPVLFCAIFILGLVGNSVAIMVLCGHKSPRTVANVCIVNLAVADLLALATVPFWAAYYAYGYNWLFGPVICKLASSILCLSMFASIFFIMRMSVSRCQAIVHPFRAQRGTLRQALSSALLVWGLAALPSLPTFYFRDTLYIEELSVTACVMAFPLERYSSWSAGMALMKNLLGFLVPLVVITVCYGWIWVHLRRARRFQRGKRTRDRVPKLVAAVVVAFVICWLPFHILTFMDALSWVGVIRSCPVTSAIDVALPFGLSMGFVSSCINPFLYYFIGRQFRDRLQHLLKLRLYQFSSSREVFCPREELGSTPEAPVKL
uniref:Type-2 angiotensin II receptor n=1 Tax=Varanus komodoensis TaxID=61221 RepID=A0A8D2L1G8_VARKO